MKRYFAVIVFALALARGAPASADPLWTFDTIPASGDRTGFVGDTVVWEYTITNLDPDSWLFVHTMNPPGFSIAAINNLFDSPIIEPGATVTGTLADALLLGPAPDFEGGALFTFSADASFYDNPDLDGSPVAEGGPLEADASVTVLARDAQVPEPSDVILLALGLGLLAVAPRLIPHIARGGRT